MKISKAFTGAFALAVIGLFQVGTGIARKDWDRVNTGVTAVAGALGIGGIRAKQGRDKPDAF